jgi:hypothetical protein
MILHLSECLSGGTTYPHILVFDGRLECSSGTVVLQLSQGFYCRQPNGGIVVFNQAFQPIHRPDVLDFTQRPCRDGPGAGVFGPEQIAQRFDRSCIFQLSEGVRGHADHRLVSIFERSRQVPQGSRVFGMRQAERSRLTNPSRVVAQGTSEQPAGFRRSALSQQPGGSSTDTGMLVGQRPRQERQCGRVTDRTAQGFALIRILGFIGQHADPIVGTSVAPVVPDGSDGELTDC